MTELKDAMLNVVINDRYRVESKVGSGGMADVYKAYDIKEDRYVAVKMIKKEHCEDAQYIRRFDCEAKTVLSLKCKNIVSAYDFGSFNGRRYIVFEYVEGCTLKESLQKHGALNPRTAVKIASSVLDALEYAHNAGFIHRDVKPQNVMISSDKSIMLTDFGIAKNAEASTRTYDGSNVLGSVHYISPEQAKGEPVEITSDLYSVGIMLYEMLIGKPPYDGENYVQIALKHISEDLTPLNEIDPAIPPALSDVIIKATSKDVSHRYQSAADMRRDLERALAQPKKHFVELNRPQSEAANDNEENRSGGYGRAKLWHVVLPVTIMIMVVVGILGFWYAYMLKDAGKEGMTRVPTLEGRTFEEARELCANRELEIKIVGSVSSDEVSSGCVFSQEPKSGTSCEEGTVIEVVLSSGSDTVSMISIIGKTLEQASLALEELDIAIGSVSYSESNAAEGTIIWQSIADGDAAVRGDSVDVTISGTKGVSQMPMPDLTIFKDPRQAGELLKIYGFMGMRFRYATYEMLNAASNHEMQNGTVIAQSPNVGIPVVPSNTYVDVYIYFDEDNAAHADFSHSFVVDSDASQMMVTVVTDIGEFVVYETELDAGTRNVEFRAAFNNPGRYECVIYLNNAELTRIQKDFS